MILRHATIIQRLYSQFSKKKVWRHMQDKSTFEITFWLRQQVITRKIRRFINLSYLVGTNHISNNSNERVYWSGETLSITDVFYTKWIFDS